MNSESRKQKIIDYLKKNKTVTILNLSKTLKVSRETIRKDIYELEKAGFLKKTHGGAVLDSSNQESDYEKRKTLNDHEKNQIAEEAVKHIEEGDTIYLDYGTTTFMLAKKLSNFKNITVITNTIPIINELLRNEGINLIILGGSVRKNEDSLFGQMASNNIKDIYVDIGFFGCGGIDPKTGITNHHMGETYISKEMLDHCKSKIFLADHSKFNVTALNKTTELKDVDIIITNEEVDEELKNGIENEGVELIVSNSQQEG